MRVRLVAAFVGLVALVGSSACSPAPSAAAATACAPPATARVRTTLYFGLARPTGTVSEREWEAFVREEVTPRFPDGFTVWGAAGQWRGADGAVVAEGTKVVALVHADAAAAREAVLALVERYKGAFEQEAVLWETAPVCAAF